MGLPKYTIYKYVRTSKGWRYRMSAYSDNNKIKPNVVIVSGEEQTHPEGAYYFQLDGRWERISESAVEAQQERKKRLARQWYQRQTGEKLPEPENENPKALRKAIVEYLAELELKVASRNRKQTTLDLMKGPLNEFATQSNVRYLHEVTTAHMDSFAAWAVSTSPTKSAQTGRNKFLRVFQFLKCNDAEKLAEFGFYQGIGFLPYAGYGLEVVHALTRKENSPLRAAAAGALVHDPDPLSGKRQ